jgi:hypothetical protein
MKTNAVERLRDFGKAAIHLIAEILAVVKYYSNFAPSKKIVNLE